MRRLEGVANAMSVEHIVVTDGEWMSSSELADILHAHALPFSGHVAYEFDDHLDLVPYRVSDLLKDLAVHTIVVISFFAMMRELILLFDASGVQ